MSKLVERHIFKLYRYCNRNQNSKSFFRITLLRIIYKYYSTLLAIFFGAYLPYRAQIGQNLQLNHSLHGVFISEHSKIGNNCTILQHTIIGSNQPLNNNAPIIEDNVFIGANCCIIGETVLGENTIVGAGTTIANKYIPPNSKIVGEKFRFV